MLIMSLVESEEMNNFLDGFLELKIQDWKVEDLNTIGKFTQQIIDYPNKEVATIMFNKLL